MNDLLKANKGDVIIKGEETYIVTHVVNGIVNAMQTIESCMEEWTLVYYKQKPTSLKDAIRLERELYMEDVPFFQGTHVFGTAICHLLIKDNELHVITHIQNDQIVETKPLSLYLKECVIVTYMNEPITMQELLRKQIDQYMMTHDVLHVEDFQR